MDIDQEIAIHLEWIESLVSLIGAESIPDEAIDEVCHHDRCEMSRWLNSDESSGFRDFPAFGELKSNHAAFHSVAGDLIKAFRAGDEARVDELQAAFLAASRNVIGYLTALKEHAA